MSNMNEVRALKEQQQLRMRGVSYVRRRCNKCNKFYQARKVNGHINRFFCDRCRKENERGVGVML